MIKSSEHRLIANQDSYYCETIVSRKGIIPMKFNIIFGTVAGLTIASALVALSLANHNGLNEHQVELLIKATDTYQLGIGSLFGLLGSKLL
jgi:uncharacterized membrane protein YccC